MNKCALLFTASVFGTLASVAAQFTPTAGGDIDDPANWNGSGTLAVAQQLTGPLTLSKSPASMPSGTTTLYFRSFANTCDFGAGNVLNMGTIPLSIEQNGTLRLASGKITGNIYVNEAYSGTGSGPGMLVLDGPTAVLEPTTLSFRSYQTSTGPWENKLVVTNGAKLAMGNKPFVVYGGWNAGFALITGVGSTLETENIYMGGKYANSTTYEGWNDHPGVQRTLEFAQGSTNAISGSVYLGCNETSQDSVSGGNVLKIASEARLTIANLFFGPSNNDSGTYDGSTNNTVLVDGGTLRIDKDVMFGRAAVFKGNRIEVKGGGRLELTDAASAFHALQVGMAADGDVLSVEGEGSVLDLSRFKLFVGGRDPYASSCNRVEIKNGGEIRTGLDSYLGYLGGHDNRLTLLNGATFTNAANFYVSGPTSVLEVAGSEFSVAGALMVDPSAADSVVRLGEGAAVTANSIALKTPSASFSATGAAIGVKKLDLVAGCGMTFTNSTLSLSGTVAGTLGANDVSLSFHGGSVFNIGYSSSSARLTLGGDRLTVRLDDSTLDASGIANDWFLTGSSTSDGVRRFIFEGARPYLKTTSTGFYLRGSEIDLVFNLGRDGFPTDRPVVDVQGSGLFNTDGKASHLVAVNVSGDCPDGTYELMCGTNAGTFLNSDRYVLTCAEGRKAKLIRETNSVSVKVWDPKGLALIFR